MTIAECFDMQHKGCFIVDNMSTTGNSFAPDHASQMSFFCGHSTECDVFNSQRLLDIAKSNVEKHFAVVGVLEDWEMSLEVLENYIPRFFAGSREAFKENEEIRHVNKNIYKPKTPTEFKQKLSEKLSKEIEFYHFCRQRLRKQYLALQEGF